MEPQNLAEDELETETIGHAICTTCNERSTVKYTKAGLQCPSCSQQPTQTEIKPTYAPSLRNGDTREEQQLAENVEQFNDEFLPDVCFHIELQDGTTYEMDESETAAVLLKHGDEWRSYLKSFASKVAEYYEKETEPTKYAEYAPWGASDHSESQIQYDSHTELAPVVAYNTLRAAKMQLSLMAMTNRDESQEAPSVIELGKDTITQYSSQGRITVEWDDFNTDTEDNQ